jgi:hypothetical protein
MPVNQCINVSPRSQSQRDHFVTGRCEREEKTVGPCIFPITHASESENAHTPPIVEGHHATVSICQVKLRLPAGYSQLVGCGGTTGGGLWQSEPDKRRRKNVSVVKRRCFVICVAPYGFCVVLCQRDVISKKEIYNVRLM